MSELTAERLREVLDYDPETGVFTWKVRTNSRVNVGDVAGCLNHLGYISIGIDGRRHSAHRLAWLHVHGYFPPNDIDHIDGDRAANRISNLRFATRSENMQNQSKPHANNKTGLLGVSRSQGKFRAQINVDGMVRYLGTFNTPEEASSAYLEAKRKLHSHCTI